jgi:cytochrome c oxidase assembly factor CtaG
VSELLPPLGLGLLGILYARGAWRLAARPGSARALGRWRPAGFLGGVTVLTVALGSPLHEAAEASLAAHMVQHLLLVVVGAPLLAGGRPLTVLAAAGTPVRAIVRRTAPLVRGVLSRPVVVWAAHVGVLWLWHLPRPYVAALEDPVVHAVEHVTLLGTAVLFWLVVAEPDVAARGGSMPAACYLFAAAMQCAVLGALLTLSETPWYPAAASAMAERLADQQRAGVLMWVPAGLVYLAATLAVVARLLRVERRSA